MTLVVDGDPHERVGRRGQAAGADRSGGCVGAFRGDGEPATPAELDALLAAFPPGTRMQVSPRQLRPGADGHRRTYFDIVDTPLDDPMNDGRFGAVRGASRGPARRWWSRRSSPTTSTSAIGDRYRLDRLRPAGAGGRHRAAEQLGRHRVRRGSPARRAPDVDRRSCFDLPDRADPERVGGVRPAPAGWQFERRASGGSDDGARRCSGCTSAAAWG